jgi:capsular polysaccharide transport system permease protein
MISPVKIVKRSPWLTQYLVLRALMEREVASRFGQYNLGFFWMLFQPILGVVVMGIIIAPFIGRSVPQIPYAFFILNGFLLLSLFMGPMKAGFKAVRSNQGLQVYPTVKPFDPILARFLYDLITIMFSFILFCLVGMWLGIELSLASLHVILAAYLITWLIGCGLGLIFGVLSTFYPETDKIVTVIFRPMMLFSAVLIPTNTLPLQVREILLYNPLVHAIELSRHSLFPLYRVEGANLLYPMCFAITLLYIGITYYEKNKNHLSQL